MRNSIEAQVTRAKWQVFGWRTLTLTVAVPATLSRLLAGIFNTFGNVFGEYANTVFAMEADAARRYENLTGVRLGPAIGKPERYTDLHREDGWPRTFAE